MENTQVSPIQPNISTTPQVNQSPIFLSPPKQPKLPIIVLSLLSLIFFAGTIYFYIQTESLKQKEIVNVPTPAPQSPTANQIISPPPTIRPISDEISNWQTYTNQKYGFSFKYPLDWIVTPSPTAGDEFNIIVDKKSNKSEGGFVPFQISVNMTKNQDGSNFTTLSEAKNYFYKSFDSSLVKTNNITLDDKPGVIITGVMAGPGPGEGQFISYTLVQLNNRVLVMQLGQESYQGSFDQITSTLKFAN